MTIEEMQALLDAAANPDSAPEALVMLKDGVTKLIDANAAMTKEKEATTKTMETLRSTNAFLLTRANSGAMAPQEDKKEIGEMNRDELKAFFAERMKEAMNNGKS